MRLTVLSLCVFAAACSGSDLNSPTSPTAAARPAPSASVAAGTHAEGASHLPFKGSYTFSTRGVVTFPTLRIQGVASGTATHLGRFSAATIQVVDLLTSTGTGTFTFTAANGDQLVATTVGGEEAFTPPNISHVREVATIVSGTGRLAGATGTFTIVSTSALDFAAGTSAGEGQFEAHLSLKP